MVSESPSLHDTESQSLDGALPSFSRWSLSLQALRFSERKFLLGFLDLLLLNSAFWLTLHFRLSPITKPRMGVEQLPWFIILTGLWLSCAFVMGCYDLVTAGSVFRSWWRTGSALILTWIIYLLTPYVTPDLPTSRLEILTFPLLAMFSLGLWRLVYATIFVRPNFQQRAIVVGAGWAGVTLAQTLREMGQDNGRSDGTIGYRILGFTDDDPAKQGQSVEGLAVLGNRHDLVNLAHRLKPHEIVVAITHLEHIHSDLFDAIQECRELGISITTMAGLYTRLTGRIPIEHAGRTLEVALPIDESASHRFYPIVQRFFDILGALVGCCLLLVVAPVVWLANRFSAPGPL
ncbi:hypothetical protein EON80_22940, partial [bacterium]